MVTTTNRRTKDMPWIAITANKVAVAKNGLTTKACIRTIRTFYFERCPRQQPPG